MAKVNSPRTTHASNRAIVDLAGASTCNVIEFPQ